MKNHVSLWIVTRLAMAMFIGGMLSGGGVASGAESRPAPKHEASKSARATKGKPDWQSGQRLGSGDGRIHVIPTLSSPSVKNGETLTIQAVVKATAGVAKVEAEIEGVARLELKATGQKGALIQQGAGSGDAAGLYQVEWTAQGLKEKVYPVALRVTDRSGHVFVDYSLSFSDPAVGITTPGSSAFPLYLAEQDSLMLNTGEINLRSAVIDPAGEYAYFGAYCSPGRIIKVCLSDFSFAGALTLDEYDINVTCGVIDPTGTYAYFGIHSSYYEVGAVVKVRLSDFTRVGSLPISDLGSSQITCAAIDPTGEYAYFGAHRFVYYAETVLIRIRLTDFSKAGVLNISTPNNITSLAIAPDGEFAYMCSFYDQYFHVPTACGVIVKIQLSDFTIAGSLTVNDGPLVSAVIDPAGEYGYFGMDPSTGDSPGAIIKVRLADLSRVGTLVLNEGEYSVLSAVMDPSGEYACFGISNNDHDYPNGFWVNPTYTTPSSLPGSVIKVRLSDFTRVATLPLEAGECDPACAVLDPARGCAYFGTTTSPGVVVKVGLTDLTRQGALTLNAAENNPQCALIDPAGKYAYFSLDAILNSPARIIRIRVSDFQRDGVLTLEPGDVAIKTSVIDDSGEYAYFGTGTSPGRVIKIRLSDFTHVGSLTLNPEENNLACAVIDSQSGYAYFGTQLTYPPNDELAYIIKVQLSNLTRVGALALPGKRSITTGVIDPAHGYAYFCDDKYAEVLRVDLNNFCQAGALAFGSGISYGISSLIDPTNGYAYFFTADSSGKLIKVRLSDFSVVQTINTGYQIASNSGAIDITNGDGYFGTTYGGLIRFSLSNCDYLGGCGINSQSQPTASILVDPVRRFAYASGLTSPGTITRAKLSLNDCIYASRITLREPAILNEMRFYSHKATGNLRLAIYSNVMPYDSESTKTLLWESAATSNTAEGDWFSVPIAKGKPSSLTLAPGYYWLAWQTDTTANVASHSTSDPRFYYTCLKSKHDYGPFPQTIPQQQFGLSNYQWSQYLTYTVPRAKPTNPGASAITPTSITWSWTDNSVDETGFKVWADAGTNTPTTLRTITAANATSWTMTGLTPNTPYTFRVAATTASGDSSSTLNYTTTTAFLPPTIITNPASRTVNVGQSASFSVTAGGTEPFAYQWKKNGVKLSGVQAATLTFNPVAYGDAGIYTCEVSNAGGMATSKAAQLTVQPTLTIVSDHGTLSPQTGTAAYPAGTLVTIQLAAATVTDSAGTTRWICTGWKGTGAAPASGTATSVSFKLTQPSTITWQWKTQYKLTVTADPASRGSVKLGDGVTAANGTWQDASNSLALKAVPNPGSRFAFWWGSLTGRANPGKLTLNGPAKIVAKFEKSGNGVKNWKNYAE